MKKDKIVINDKDFFEDLIWMSYRYCIGRKTIAAHCHANNIVSVVDKLSIERRRFMAKDIRMSINDTIRWKHNIHDDGYTNKYDALTLIYKYLLEHPEIEDDTKFKFNVNTDNGNVNVEPFTNDKGYYMESIYDLYNDFGVWIDLANYLDDENYVVVKAQNKDNIEEYKSFLSPYVFQKKIKFIYKGCDCYKKNPYICSYINPEYIIEVK